MQSLAEDQRRALLRAHGSFPLAYSVAFQPGLLHFGDDRGFLSYKMVGRTAFVLADPLAGRERVTGLIEEFVAARKDVAFFQTSHEIAVLLAERGFFVNAFGPETELDLSTFDFAGPRLRSFRTALNRMVATGAGVREASFAELDRGRIASISEAWRGTRTTRSHELRFLVRPVVLDDEPGVRKFFLFDPDGKPVGFAFFDPIYEAGQVTGYLSATRRWLPEADPLAAYMLVRCAVDQCRAEGIRRFNLGLSPFHRIEDNIFRPHKNWLARRAFRFAYTNGLMNRFVYPAQTLARHKALYGGKMRQTYFCFNTLPALPRLLKLAWACRIV